MIRAPICAVVGHVDHGKTTLLDKIRGTATAAGEAGAITQAIGASIIPIDHIIERSNNVLKKEKVNIPGLLFIDTPGHAAFTGMRKRGGSLADIAVLIVDINEGFKPQTQEALEILKNYKTPFIVAANKVDIAPGYKHQEKNILADINAQDAKTNQYIETKTYELVAKLQEMGMPADRFDRVEGFDKQIAIVPISALNGYGLDTLLTLIVGLAQKYLQNNLNANVQGPARGTVLEVTEEKGLGTTLNTIIYDGTLKVGDHLVIAGIGKTIETKVRALLQPEKGGDLRDSKTKFANIKQAAAATGVKISAPGLDEVMAGMPFIAENSEKARQELVEDVDQVTFETDHDGVIVKADNVGSLEAVVTLLREKNIPINSASIGPVTKKDLITAASQPEEYKVVLAFNTKAEEKQEGVKVLDADIIYKLIDDYEAYHTELTKQKQEEAVGSMPKVAKMRILPNCIFRQSNPLVCGVEIMMGELKKTARLVKEKDPTTTLAYVKDIQDKGSSTDKAQIGMQVAISLPGVIGGRHVQEGDVLWAAVSEEEFRGLKDNAKLIDAKQKDALREYAEVMRERNPLWGV